MAKTLRYYSQYLRELVPAFVRLFIAEYSPHPLFDVNALNSAKNRELRGAAKYR